VKKLCYFFFNFTLQNQGGETNAYFFICLKKASKKKKKN